MADSHEVDPTEFVQRIRKLGEERDQQDAERVRKLEEEILQGRTERQARRAERQRSISPQKSAAGTPQSLRSTIDTPKGQRGTLSSPEIDSPGSINTREDASGPPQLEGKISLGVEQRSDAPQFDSAIPAQALEEPQKASASPSIGLGRSGTLSWQQRPKSLGARRPFSMVSTDSNTPRSPRGTPDPPVSADKAVSRAEIAQNLEAKDPSWFRQTPDRGTESPAFRRSEEPGSPNDSGWDGGRGASEGRRQLPGMSNENTRSTEDSEPSRPESLRSMSPSRAGSVRGSAVFSNRFSTNTSLSDTSSIDAKSPMPLEDEKSRIGRSMAMSPTQGRVERTPSPTKGAGGFVQSAILKRSDSVKRWSAQGGPNISRQNSNASIRSGLGGPREGNSTSIKLEGRPISLSRGNSLEPGSRPSSSHSNTTITQEPSEKAGNVDNSGFVKPALPLHSRSKSVAADQIAATPSGNTETSPPPSPSKRWSPTKSSWLESALNKPDSPKPKMAPLQQPSWMQELNKAKQQRASGDAPRAAEPSKLHSAEAKKTSTALPPTTSSSEGVENDDTITGQGHDVQKKDAKPASSPTPKAKPISLSPQQSKKDPPPETTESTSTALETKKPQISSTAVEKNKARPETPPKRDFRANLKSRDESKGTAQKEEPEFKNVFGKLKRTTTEKYVAPDVLKDNILRGKAGLNITGGPKPSARRDELKESLIKQKEAMKTKALESGPPVDQKSKPRELREIPEAIAKRKNLGRFGNNSTDEIAKGNEESLVSKITEVDSFSPPSNANEGRVTSQPPKKIVASSKLADRFNPALAGILARGPRSDKTSEPTEVSSTRGSSARSKPEEDNGKSLTHITKGRARGPKRRAPGGKADQPTKGSPEDIPVDKSHNPVTEHTPSSETPRPVSTPIKDPSKPLSKPSPSISSSKSPPTVSPKPNLTSVPLVRPQHVLLSTAADTDESKRRQESSGAGASTPSASALSRPVEKTKPLAPIKSPVVTEKIGQQQQDEPAHTARDNPHAPEKSRPRSISPEKKVLNRWSQHIDINKTPIMAESNPTRSSKAVSPQKITNDSPLEHERVGDEGKASVRDAASFWGRQPAQDSPKPSGSREPIKLPTRKDEEVTMENAGLNRPAKAIPTGLGLSSLSFGRKPTSLENTNQSGRAKDLPDSPVTVGRSMSDVAEKAALPKQVTSDHIFAPYFDIPPDTSGDLPANIDTQSLLDSYPIKSERKRTLHWDVHEISGDGKLISVPSQDQHVLFDESMYVCAHVTNAAEPSQRPSSYFSSSPKQTDVYLWVGCAIPESTLEDVQLFARRFAKDKSGKFSIIRQGKEPPEFFEASGGIVVMRKGSRMSRANYLLCGRKHLGHIVFDERPFALKSFCSGFAYLAMAEKNLYLWKGRGCNPDEVSAARLVGMDMLTSGSLIEIEEGGEDSHPAFLSAFPHDGKGPHAVPRSAEHWRNKAGSDRYRTRLFRVEQSQDQQQGLKVSAFLPGFMLRRPSWQNLVSPTSSSPQSHAPPLSPLPRTQEVRTEVVEVAPFVQGDLAADRIFVLDAFFEVYILIQPLTRGQSHAFSTALLFAQEYSILAASAEDRPFVPVCTVIMEGVPRDMKFVFRRWEEAEQDTGALMAGRARPGESAGLTRGRSLKICGLEKALRATRVEEATAQR